MYLSGQKFLLPWLHCKKCKATGDMPAWVCNWPETIAKQVRHCWMSNTKHKDLFPQFLTQVYVPVSPKGWLHCKKCKATEDSLAIVCNWPDMIYLSGTEMACCVDCIVVPSPTLQVKLCIWMNKQASKCCLQCCFITWLSQWYLEKGAYIRRANMSSLGTKHFWTSLGDQIQNQ